MTEEYYRSYLKEKEIFSPENSQLHHCWGKVYFRDENGVREVIADDGGEELKRVLDELHLPNYAGMKGMYIRSKIKYVGFKRERINDYVSNCIACQRHEPLPRIAPIIPIISEYSWHIVQIDCVDLKSIMTVIIGS